MKPIKESLCPAHAKKYLLIPDDGLAQTWLCVHPLCLEKAIRSTVNKYRSCGRSWDLVVNKHAVEDFVQYIALQLCIEKSKGKRLLSINGPWLYFRILSFINIELKKFLPLTDLPSKVRGNKTFMEFKPELVDAIEDVISWTTEVHQNPEMDLIIQDTIKYMRDSYGDTVTLYILGVIDTIDLAKILKTNPYKARNLVKKARIDLKDYWFYK